MKWTFDPGVIAWLVVGETLYVRALVVLSGRGFRVPRKQIVFWHVGILLWITGLISPVDALGDRLLSAHMAEHLLIADLAAPFFLAGIRTPVLVFLLPASTLTLLAKRVRLRKLLRTVRKPMVAVPIYILVLYGWHSSFAFENAVRHPLVHAFQHASFTGIGLLVWWSALEPKRARLRGELWKIGHIFAARLAGMFLGMSFVLVREPLYTSVYGAGDRGYGLTAIGDQQLAGAFMVVTDIALVAFSLIFFFYRAAQDYDRGGEERSVRAQ